MSRTTCFNYGEFAIIKSQNRLIKYNHPKTSANWSGVNYLYNFLINNKDKGPYGKTVNAEETIPGDIVQLGFDGKAFQHTLFIVETDNTYNLDNIKVAAHTFDSDYKAISSYVYKEIRFIHIEGIRK